MSINALTTWEFRYSENNINKNILINFLKKHCKKWVFQLEEGELNGYKHFQGRMKTIKRMYKKPLMALFTNEQINIPNYLEPTTSVEHTKGSFFYVLKELTRLDGPWTDAMNEEDEDMDDNNYFSKFINDPTIFKPYTLDGFNFNKLYPFQKKILLSSKKENRNSRVIDLIIDPEGCNGKSTISNYIRIGKFGITMPCINDSEKIVSSCCDILSSKDCRNPKIIIFDLPRAMTKSRLHGFMCAFEQIKSGFVYDPRNKWQEWEFQPPRIWVFCNSLLDLNLLSKDRWNLWSINKDKDLYKYDYDLSRYDINECEFIDDESMDETINYLNFSDGQTIPIKRSIHEI